MDTLKFRLSPVLPWLAVTGAIGALGLCDWLAERGAGVLTWFFG